MKKTINYFICLITLSFLISSCNSKFLLKRHYRSGYYISNSHKHTSPKSIEHNKSELDEPTFKTPESNEMNLSDIITDYSINNNDVFQGELNNKYSSINEATYKKSFEGLYKSYKTKESLSSKKVIKRNIVQLKKTSIHKSDDDKDGLSLLWVIIIIVLILWAVGYLAFALGAFIHLLLIIALVLLILWLLRII